MKLAKELEDQFIPAILFCDVRQIFMVKPLECRFYVIVYTYKSFHGRHDGHKFEFICIFFVFFLYSQNVFQFPCLFWCAFFLYLFCMISSIHMSLCVFFVFPKSVLKPMLPSVFNHGRATFEFHLVLASLCFSQQSIKEVLASINFGAYNAHRCVTQQCLRVAFGC